MTNEKRFELDDYLNKRGGIRRILLAESADEKLSSVEKKLTMTSHLLNRPAPLVYARAHFIELTDRKGKTALDMFNLFNINEERLWPISRATPPFTYRDWFAMMNCCRHLAGPDYPVIVSEHVGLHMYPYMEAMVATAPDFWAVLRIWELYSDAVEPLITVDLLKTAKGATLKITYPLAGELLEAYTMHCAALVCDMTRASSGRHVTCGMSLNIDDTNDNKKKFEALHRVKLDRFSYVTCKSLKTAPVIEYKIPAAILYAKAIGRDDARHLEAMDRFTYMLNETRDLFPKTSGVAEQAVCIQTTAETVLTIDEMSARLGYQPRSYQRTLKKEGHTHKTIIEQATSNNIRTLLKLGYSQKETSDRLGINSNRQFKQYM